MTCMLTRALEYLASEWPVFPVCHPGTPGRCAEHQADKHTPEDVGKRPLVYWSEYQRRLPTETEIRRWWRQWPDANIGMATGELSGVCVVDLDGGYALTEADRRGYLPGPWATTGRVGGQHLYFAWRPDAPTIFAKRSGIDFRGQGGFVLLPPSLHRSGVRYRWQEPPSNGEPLPPLPGWVDELAAERSGPHPVGAVDGDIAQGMRNAALLSIGGAMRRYAAGYRAIEAALLIENHDRCKPPLDEDEVRKIAASVCRYSPSANASATASLPTIVRPAGGRLPPLVHPRSTTTAMAGARRA